MIKAILETEGIERIELKFECLRRSEAYRRDYKRQLCLRKDKRAVEFLEAEFLQKWYHFPLLDPDILVDAYREKDAEAYPCWLEKTLGGLIKDDPLSPQGMKIESPEIRKFIAYSRSGYKSLYDTRKGKLRRVALPNIEKVLKEVDRQKVEKELRGVKIALDLKGFTLLEVKQEMEQLLKELKPLVNAFLYKESSVSIRPSAVREYLKAFDRRQGSTWGKISDDENEQRKLKKQVGMAKILIQAGWREI